MIQVFINGVLREQWNDSTRTYTAWDASGVQTSTRAYNATENTDADKRAITVSQTNNAKTIETNLQQDVVTMQTIIDSTNTTINNNPASYIKDIARVARRLAKRELKDYNNV